MTKTAKKQKKELSIQTQKNHCAMKTDSKEQKRQVLFSVLTGLISGLINGVFGGGGGMIVVPMLVFLLKYTPKNAHATAILIILPLSIVSGLIYAGFGNLNLLDLAPVLGGVILGGVGGALLLSKMTSKWIVILFSVVMAGAGVKMLVF